MTLINSRIRRRLAIAFMSLLFCAPGLSGAQVPDTIAYAGFLRDSVGNPITGNVPMQFDLYASASGGVSLWSETHGAVAVLSGVFNVALGSLTTFASAGLVFDKPLFLGITVNGEALDSRVAFHASPYSLATAPLESNVSVDCGNGGNLADALSNAPVAKQLNIDISGTCTGNLQINRNNLTISSSDGTGIIQAVTPGTNVFNTAIGIEGRKHVNFDNVTIQGAAGDATGMHGITLSDGGNVALINGAIVQGFNGHGVLVVESSNLDLFDSFVQNNAQSGIIVDSNSQVDLTNSTVSGNTLDGIYVALSSGADLRNSTVSGNSRHGVRIVEGSAGRIREGSEISGNGIAGDGEYQAGLFVDEASTARVLASTVSTTGHDGRDGPALAVLRGSSVRIFGGSTISAPHAATTECPQDCTSVPYSGGGGMAIDVEMNSTLRLDGGKTMVAGNIYTYNLSTVDLRDMVQTGNFVASDGLSANLRLRDQSPEDGLATVGGTLIYSGNPISIRKGGHAERALIGTVQCLFGNSAPGDIDFLGGTPNYVGCPGL